MDGDVCLPTFREQWMSVQERYQGTPPLTSQLHTNLRSVSTGRRPCCVSIAI